MTTLTALLDAIRDAPDDPAPYLVYADALGDDPRGELIALQLARERDPARAELDARIAELTARVLAELPVQVRATWRRGFITAAAIPPTDEFPALLAHPLFAVVTALELRGPEQRVRTLLHTPAPLPHLAQIALGDLGVRSPLDLPLLERLRARFPRLDSFTIDGTTLALDLVPALAPCTRRLELELGEVSADLVEAIASQHWPHLERLAVRAVTFAIDRDDAAYSVPLLLDRRTMPALVELELDEYLGGAFTTLFCAWVSRSGLLQRLRALAFSFTGLDVTELADHAWRFRHLDSLCPRADGASDADMLGTAAQFLAELDPPRALRCLDRAIPRARDLPLIHDLLQQRASIALLCNRPADALADADAALGIHAECGRALYNRARALAMLGELAEARTEAARAYAAIEHPARPDETLLLIHSLDDAPARTSLVELDGLLAHRETGEAHYARAVVGCLLGDLAAARQALAVATDRYPAYAELARVDPRLRAIVPA